MAEKWVQDALYGVDDWTDTMQDKMQNWGHKIGDELSGWNLDWNGVLGDWRQKVGEWKHAVGNWSDDVLEKLRQAGDERTRPNVDLYLKHFSADTGLILHDV